MGRRKERAAVELGRRGGKAAAGAGAKKRWKKIPPAERAEIMRRVRRAGLKRRG